LLHRGEEFPFYIPVIAVDERLCLQIEQLTQCRVPEGRVRTLFDRQ
jgi:hypothetical protein